MNPARFFADYAALPERRLVGLMSGTSVDGVDVVRVHLSGSGRQTQVEQIAFHTYPLPSGLRQAVLDLSHGLGNAEQVSRASVALAEVFADAVTALGGGPIEAVASHGQTISHTPAPLRDAGGGRATLQIGSAAVLAQRLGCVVVSDFRSADIAAGGQGAPLVPYADWCLLTHPSRSRAIQNIGGIGNVTFLPPNAASDQVRGFDTGPGNMLIDQAVRQRTGGALHYDRDGALARSGKVDPLLLKALLRHPFLAQRPPKSAGREEFGAPFWQSVLEGRQPDADLVATLTRFTAESIAEAYERYLPTLPEEVIVGGGGAQNTTLMEMLRDRLSPIPVRTHEELGWDGDAKEALAFCLLANETLLGNPANLPSVTGATRPVTLGSVTFP